MRLIGMLDSSYVRRVAACEKSVPIIYERVTGPLLAAFSPSCEKLAPFIAAAHGEGCCRPC